MHSSIEWTQSSWNPVTGRTKISEGCKNCYAERMAHRLKAMGQKNYAQGFTLTVQEEMRSLFNPLFFQAMGRRQEKWPDAG